MKNQILATGAVMLFIIGSVTFISCNNSTSDENKNTENNNTSGNEKPENTNEPNNTQANALSPIIDAYLQVKNALAEDNADNTAKAGEKLISAFKSFDKSLLKESQATKYTEIAESALENAEHISENADKIDHQREHLVFLSKDLKDLITLIGTNKKLYQDYCPMANNGKGAMWISEMADIKNPYMGSEMPTCGEIKEEIN